MARDVNGESDSTDRRRIRTFAAVSLIMLVGSVALRALAPSPFAPRVDVRWADGIADAQRTELERRFALVEGQRREYTTWAYDLTELSPAAVLALVRNPAVADTHYIDRDTGEVAADAPHGTARLGDRWVAGWIHSALFEWFILFWVSALVVSGVWLGSSNAQRHRRRIRTFAAVSLIMLVGSVALRALAPSPFAPRVHVRWTDGITDARRTELERRFALVEGQREDTTWAYDLTDQSPSAVLAFLENPAVADTHYIDRDTGEVAADAPRGTTRLSDRWAAGWIHSALFEWFILLWVSALVVSGAWLASSNAQRH